MHRLAFLSLTLLAGCTSSIAYTPLCDEPPPPIKTIVLRIVDGRPAEKGGSDKQTVGQVLGSYGIPYSVTDANPNIVVESVSQSTADALAHAGVGVGEGTHTLTGTVRQYWLDGFAGYTGTITVGYALSDASGATLWSEEIVAATSDAPIFKSAQAMSQDLFGKALSDLAKRAVVEFKSPAFQGAL
jgi:hypothetical protein